MNPIVFALSMAMRLTRETPGCRLGFMASAPVRSSMVVSYAPHVRDRHEKSAVKTMNVEEPSPTIAGGAADAIPRHYNFADDILHRNRGRAGKPAYIDPRSEEHTSEL